MIPPKTEAERREALSIALDGGYYAQDEELSSVFDMANDKRTFADPFFDECYAIGNAAYQKRMENKIKSV